jgi:hypothetical protein
MKTPPLVEVSWTDACNNFGPSRTLEEARRVSLTRRRTVGYLVLNEDRVIVAETFDEPENIDDVPEVENLTVIPAGWVQKIKYLRGGPKRDASTSPASDGRSCIPHADAKRRDAVAPEVVDQD